MARLPKKVVNVAEASPVVAEAIEEVVVNEVDEVIEEAKKLIESGAKLAQIKGFLAYKGIGHKDITRLVLELIPAKEIKARGKTVRSVMWGICSERVMEISEFNDLFKTDWITDNQIKHKAIFDAERKMFNKIHGKYSK